MGPFYLILLPTLTAADRGTHRTYLHIPLPGYTVWVLKGALGNMPMASGDALYMMMGVASAYMVVAAYGVLSVCVCGCVFGYNENHIL